MTSSILLNLNLKKLMSHSVNLAFEQGVGVAHTFDGDDDEFHWMKKKLGQVVDLFILI